MDFETAKKMKCMDIMKDIPTKELEHLYYTYFVTCQAFSQLANIVEDGVLRGFILSSFKKEFSAGSLSNLLYEHGYQ